jgi:hypothetical protein
VMQMKLLQVLLLCVGWLCGTNSHGCDVLCWLGRVLVDGVDSPSGTRERVPIQELTESRLEKVPVWAPMPQKMFSS